jgi:hypothetical protein
MRVFCVGPYHGFLSLNFMVRVLYFYGILLTLGRGNARAHLEEV